MQTAWKTDRRESVRTLQFRMLPGDTVYATRSGIVCRTMLPRQLLICHADYTFAAYLAMNENFVSPGEEVRTGQPVGIAGPTGGSFSSLIKINSADWKPPDMSIHTLRRYSVLRKAM